MIHKCIALFNLLPTSQTHIWLIAADWLEENNLDITAIAFREGVWNLEIRMCGFGSGSGIGSYKGYCHSTGIGGGSGFDSGFDSGWGERYGFGDGSGNGEGSGDGYGNGHSCGYRIG
jgi:hypothetical protein